MNEDELKETIGEEAFNAMSEDQRSALLGKFEKPEPDPKPKDDPKAKDDPKPKDDDDLISKARKEREAAEKQKGEVKSIESALSFNMGVEEFVKTNKDLLPSDIDGVLKVALKEKYDSATDKANAIRSAFVQKFFEVQDNVDLLTAGQKTSLDDYLKLTKNGKEQKAGEVYTNIFEPALETLKKVKKAEELGKSRAGVATGNDMEKGYADRLHKSAMKRAGWESKGA